jgi:hypothetical protein
VPFMLSTCNQMRGEEVGNARKRQKPWNDAECRWRNMSDCLFSQGFKGWE